MLEVGVGRNRAICKMRGNQRRWQERVRERGMDKKNKIIGGQEEKWKEKDISDVGSELLEEKRGKECTCYPLLCHLSTLPRRAFHSECLCRRRIQIYCCSRGDWGPCLFLGSMYFVNAGSETRPTVYLNLYMCRKLSVNSVVSNWIQRVRDIGLWFSI